MMDEPKDNRARLLLSATRLFARHGYEAVGVQQIAEAAGVTKPTLYHYFGSKRGLLDALLAEGFADFFAALDGATPYSRNLLGPLSAYANVYFAFAARGRDFYRLQLALWFAPPQSEAFAAIVPYTERQQRFFEDFFARAAQDHGNMVGRQRAYALTFLGLLSTYAALLLNDRLQPDAELTRHAVRQFMHGIFS
jgi:AcrR family transcriptional regulator